jgi:hypothetical protein
MSPELLKVAAGVLGVGAVTLASVVAGEWLARRKIQRWARSQGFHLLEFKGAPAWRGPRAWRRTENQEDYQVLVQDATGRRRRGWLLYTSPWHSLGAQHVEVRWDESLP